MPILSTSPNWALKQQKQMLQFPLCWIPWKKTPALQASSKILMLRKCQNYFKFQALWQVIVSEILKIEYFITRSCRFLRPNYLFQLEFWCFKERFQLLDLIITELKSHMNCKNSSSLIYLSKKSFTIFAL